MQRGESKNKAGMLLTPSYMRGNKYGVKQLEKNWREVGTGRENNV